MTVGKPAFDTLAAYCCGNPSTIKAWCSPPSPVTRRKERSMPTAPEGAASPYLAHLLPW
ncbi:hypothetical protein [Tolypothrix sp. VBCCA 56010]|uniref:hypothetical protein n=1 Tax=Tolypothrix sp. VBCCA 56010 TaxID=3137731 RepID=UPI003D7C3A3E